MNNTNDRRCNEKRDDIHNSIKNLIEIKSLIKKKSEKNESNVKSTQNLSNIKKARDHYSCILFIKLECRNIFTERNMSLNIDGMNLNDLLIAYCLDTLIGIYRENYYDKDINSYNPKVYSIFDMKDAKISNLSYIGSNCVLLSENSTSIGLHISLTRNHLLNKKLSYLFLKNIINRFNNNKTTYQYPEDVLKPQNIEIETNMKSFGIYLDYNSILILENNDLYNSNIINGGLFAALKVHETCKKLYIDPIINLIDDICSEIGIEKHYSERIIHTSLFYIKKNDLVLKNSRDVSDNVLFREYLKNRDVEYNSSINNSLKNIIWVDKLFFRIGIYEYKLLLN